MSWICHSFRTVGPMDVFEDPRPPLFQRLWEMDRKAGRLLFDEEDIKITVFGEPVDGVDIFVRIPDEDHAIPTSDPSAST